MGSLLLRQLPALALGALCTAIIEWGTTRLSPGAVPLYARPLLLSEGLLCVRMHMDGKDEPDVFHLVHHPLCGVYTVAPAS